MCGHSAVHPYSSLIDASVFIKACIAPRYEGRYSIKEAAAKEDIVRQVRESREPGGLLPSFAPRHFPISSYTYTHVCAFG